MEKEELLFRKRIQELSRLCFERDIPVHTDFLNLNEQTIFFSLLSSLSPARYELAGGYEMAERKVVCFLPSYEETLTNYPFVCLSAKPVNPRFTEPLNHRDYLGALMNLGIDRSKIGDILIEDKVCRIFCMEDMADYVCRELHFVRHTNLTLERSQPGELSIVPNFENISGSVASLRLDCILALAWQSSRSKMTPYIEGEKVFVNGRLITSNSFVLKDGDIVSVRGFGKFIYRGVEAETKKGRLFITLDRYA